MALGFWTQPPDLSRPHPTDTNQWTLPSAALSAFAEPSTNWYAQPPDLLRHWPTLDTNEPQLTFAFGRASATPGQMAFFLEAPPPLKKIPEPQPQWQEYVGIQRFADTPQLFWWRQPPDLLRQPTGQVVQPWTRIVGWRYQFLGSAFIAPRIKLNTVKTTSRYRTPSMLARARILKGTQARTRTPDLDPITVGEIEFVTFDFGPICAVAPNNAIYTVAAVNCLLDQGTDPNAAAHVLSITTGLASPSTGQVDCAVKALFGGMVPGVTYIVQCIAFTLDGQEFALEARWSCRALV